MAGNTAEELNIFRRQWQEEVTARTKKAASSSKSARPALSLHRSSGTTQPGQSAALTFHRPYRETGDSEDAGIHGYHDLENRDEAWKLGEFGDEIHTSNRKEPTSALEHYERAVERETEGNLGDSLNHYRKAYRVRHNATSFMLNH